MQSGEQKTQAVILDLLNADQKDSEGITLKKVAELEGNKAKAIADLVDAEMKEPIQRALQEFQLKVEEYKGTQSYAVATAREVSSPDSERIGGSYYVPGMTHEKEWVNVIDLAANEIVNKIATQELVMRITHVITEFILKPYIQEQEEMAVIARTAKNIAIQANVKIKNNPLFSLQLGGGPEVAQILKKLESKFSSPMFGDYKKETIASALIELNRYMRTSVDWLPEAVPNLEELTRYIRDRIYGELNHYVKSINNPGFPHFYPYVASNTLYYKMLDSKHKVILTECINLEFAKINEKYAAKRKEMREFLMAENPKIKPEDEKAIQALNEKVDNLVYASAAEEIYQAIPYLQVKNKAHEDLIKKSIAEYLIIRVNNPGKGGFNYPAAVPIDLYRLVPLIPMPTNLSLVRDTSLLTKVKLTTEEFRMRALSLLEPGKLKLRVSSAPSKRGLKGRSQSAAEVTNIDVYQENMIVDAKTRRIAFLKGVSLAQSAPMKYQDEIKHAADILVRISDSKLENAFVAGFNAGFKIRLENPELTLEQLLQLGGAAWKNYDEKERKFVEKPSVSEPGPAITRTEPSTLEITMTPPNVPDQSSSSTAATNVALRKKHMRNRSLSTSDLEPDQDKVKKGVLKLPTVNESQQSSHSKGKKQGEASPTENNSDAVVPMQPGETQSTDPKSTKRSKQAWVKSGKLGR